MIGHLAPIHHCAIVKSHLFRMISAIGESVLLNVVAQEMRLFFSLDLFFKLLALGTEKALFISVSIRFSE